MAALLPDTPHAPPWEGGFAGLAFSQPQEGLRFASRFDRFGLGRSRNPGLSLGRLVAPSAASARSLRCHGRAARVALPPRALQLRLSCSPRAAERVPRAALHSLLRWATIVERRAHKTAPPLVVPSPQRDDRSNTRRRETSDTPVRRAQITLAPPGAGCAKRATFPPRSRAPLRARRPHVGERVRGDRGKGPPLLATFTLGSLDALLWRSSFGAASVPHSPARISFRREST